MNPRIPTKIRMQSRREIEARLLLLLPRCKPDAIKTLHHWIVGAEWVPILTGKLAQSFGHLEAHLHPHRSLRQRTHKRLKRMLRSVSRFVRVVIGVNAAEIVARDPGAVG